MAQSVMLPNFSGGELSTSLYARVDLEKYHSGASKLRNMFVDYRGGVTRRMGLEFKVAGIPDDARLIPFVVSKEASYVLVLYANTIQIYARGVLVATVTTPYAAADVWDLKYTQSADVMTLVHPAYPPYNLNRTTILPTFTFTEISFGTAIASPGQPTCTSTVPGTALSYCYCVTAVDKNGEESLASQPSECGSAVLDPTAAMPVTIGLEWTASANAVSYNVYKAGPVSAGDALPSVYGYIGRSEITFFTDNNIGPDFGQTPPQHRDPFRPGQVNSVTVTAPGTGMVGDYEPVVITGDGTDAVVFVIAKGGAGIAAGAIIINGGINYTYATGAPTSGSATFDVTVDAHNYYPACVAYYQQRRAYAGSDAAPLRVEFSRPAHFDNFDVSPTVLDSDAISISLVTQQVNRIQHMVPMSTGLVVFTEGNAFLLTGGGQSGAITPANVASTPQASTGAGKLQPIVVNYNILFQQYDGTVIRDMTFQWTTNSYFGTDRSMLANHFFSGYDLNDWAFALEPYHLLHAVRNDGKLLLMAYVPEQEVYGWSLADTQGEFKSIAAVPEDRGYGVYAIVRRYVNGAWVNYLERFFNKLNCCIDEAWYLDSATTNPRTYPPGTATLSGYTAGVVTVTASTWVPGGGDLYLRFDETASRKRWNNFEGFTYDPARSVVGWYTLDGGGAVTGYEAWSMTTRTLIHAGVLDFTLGGPPAPNHSAITDDGHVYGLVQYGSLFTNYLMRWSAYGAGPEEIVASTNNMQQVSQAMIAANGDTYIGVTAWSNLNDGYIWNHSTSSLTFIDTSGVGGDNWQIKWFILDESGDIWAVGGKGDLAANQMRFRRVVNASGISRTDQFTVTMPYNQSGSEFFVNGCFASGHFVIQYPLTGGTNITFTIEYDGTISHAVPSLSAIQNSEAQMATHDVTATTIWFENSEYSCVDLTLIRTVPLSHWEPPTLAISQGIVWDPTNNGFLAGGANGGNDFYWLLLDAGPPFVVGTTINLDGDTFAESCATLTITSVEGLVGTGVLSASITPLSPDDPSPPPIVLDSGDWSTVAPISTFTGLSHLEGKQVWALADGHVLGPFTVASGSIALDATYSNVIVGLAYSSQFATLRLDVGDPTVQGKRKVIPAVTLRLECSVGMAVGTEDFTQQQYQPKTDYGGYTQYTPGATTAAAIPFTGDVRVNVQAGWERNGIVTITQSLPLPLTILGIIPEVTVGDNMR